VRSACSLLGECSLSLCLAAGKLCGLRVLGENVMPPAGGLPWIASDIAWPTSGAAFVEWTKNRRTLEDAKVRVVEQSTDARLLHLLSGVSLLDGAVWAMPYPDAFSPAAMSPGRLLGEEMRARIHGFVRSAGPLLKRGGQVSVLLVSLQHLGWGLRAEVDVPDVGVFIPEVKVLAIEELEQEGYRPRFGDKRDTFDRRALYHHASELVAVQWRLRAGPQDAPTGMSDTKLQRRA